MAKLHFKYGAMNSGKSTVLINTAYNYEEQGLGVAVLKPAIDTKGNNLITSRTGLSRVADILITQEANVRNEIRTFRKIGSGILQSLNAVLVDESQFLSEPQVDQLMEVAKLDEISVIAFGLRTDFLTRQFPGSKRLMELSDNIEKIPTMCRCGSQAEFNCRKIGNSYDFSDLDEQVAIDGESETSYSSFCYSCYSDEKAKQSLRQNPQH